MTLSFSNFRASGISGAVQYDCPRSTKLFCFQMGRSFDGLFYAMVAAENTVNAQITTTALEHARSIILPTLKRPANLQVE